jgi:Ethanolamine utilization protein EutJ (predicted chaperonin)
MATATPLNGIACGVAPAPVNPIGNERKGRLERRLVIYFTRAGTNVPPGTCA